MKFRKHILTCMLHMAAIFLYVELLVLVTVVHSLLKPKNDYKGGSVADGSNQPIAERVAETHTSHDKGLSSQ